MGEHIFQLLGVVNPASSDVPVRTKYVIKVTAQQLASLLQYERRGKGGAKAPFRILPTSVIRVDKKIQRGTDTEGYLQQQPTKVLDIAKTLVGDPSAATRYAYLGSLVWNVRRPVNPEVSELTRSGRPPEYKLLVDTDAIYLTDSAHRHFGIVEALRLWKQKPENYPRFRPEMEFTVEVYNLDAHGEHELFYELNGKQKRASPTKLKELDVSSPFGALRNAILAFDASEGIGLLENNIEVTSVQNKYTLMTMSVFVSTLAEMFSTTEIREAREDESVRDEFAEYYCRFLYKLADTLTVRCDVNEDGSDEEIKPFRNLHALLIQPAVDAIQPTSPEESQQRIVAASERAKQEYSRLVSQDILIQNPVIKALFKVGGRIRLMEGWEAVVDRIQTELLVPLDGKFFQKDNPDWFATKDGDVPIASLNEDKSINVQVQAKNVNRIADYLFERLSLKNAAIVSTQNGGVSRVLTDGTSGVEWVVHRDTENIKTFELRFVALRSTEGYEELLRLGVDCDGWKSAMRKGKAKIAPSSVQEDRSFQHPAYTDLTRYTAYFELALPAASFEGETELALTFYYPDIDRTELKTKARLIARVE